MSGSTVANETMEDLTVDDIGVAITGMIRAFDAEYKTMTEADLNARFHFKFDPSLPIDRTMYLFYDRLALYAGSCRRWEEMHNGSFCVVERVRDKYIMPKICEFAAQISKSPAQEK